MANEGAEKNRNPYQIPAFPDAQGLVKFLV